MMNRIKLAGSIRKLRNHVLDRWVVLIYLRIMHQILQLGFFLGGGQAPSFHASKDIQQLELLETRVGHFANAGGRGGRRRPRLKLLSFSFCCVVDGSPGLSYHTQHLLTLQSVCQYIKSTSVVGNEK